MSSPALALDGLRPSATNSPPPHSHQQNLAGLSSPSSRASLLSGLRTSAVRSPSPSPLMQEQMQQQQEQQQDSEGNGSPTSSFGPSSPKNSAYHRRLKASAAIFTPNSPLAQKILNGQDQGNRGGSPNGSQDSPKSASFSNASLQQSPQGSPVNVNRSNINAHGREREMQALEDQMVAMRMQALAEQNAANVAAMYGAARGQPNHELQQLRLQQQQQQQMQLEILRLQALQQHQQQQAALAAQQQQQQHLLAQIHAEYERQMASERERGSPSQEQQQHIFGGNSEANSASSAQEQRQAAQASIQASLRNRSDRQAQQAQQQQKEFYMAMLQQQQQQQQAQAQHQGGYTQEEMIQVQQMLMLQHQQQEQAAQQQWLAQQLAAQQQAESRSSGTPPTASASPPPSDARNWRSSNVNGNGSASPAQQAQAGKRDRVASSADKSISWRNKGANPSIVIDDSASDTTDGASGVSQSDSENHHGDGETTPETSEEDLNVKTPLRKKSHKEGQSSFGKGVPTPTQASHSLNGTITRDLSQPIHFAQPRAISLAAAPRNRAFAESAASTASASAPLLQARRQPKGPPTEFKEINFAARISARTRREAVNRLNKLCKSPRTVAAFSRNVSAPVA